MKATALVLTLAAPAAVFAAAQAAVVSSIALTPHAVGEISLDHLHGNLRRLAWSPDGKTLYLQTFDQNKDASPKQLYHYLLSPTDASIKKLDADVLLLQEVDRGCDRSGRRDVAADLAAALGMNWIFAGEFQEIGYQLVVRDPQLSCDRHEWRVGRPQFQTPDQRGRQQVRVDPADSTAVQFAIAHERDHLSVGHERRLVHPLVVRQKRLAAAPVADEQLPVHEVVAVNFVEAQESVQFSGIRRAVGQKADPDRRVDQNAHAGECLADEARSRRRGVS